MVYGVLLRPLPYPAADRLVELSEEHPGAVSPLRSPMLSNLTYYAWSRRPRTIESLAGYRNARLHPRPAGGAASASTAPASRRRCFRLLGATPALGRFFRPTRREDRQRPASSVLSDRAWRERFSADPSIVGRGVVIDEQPCTIVGVAGRGFAFPDRGRVAVDAAARSARRRRTPSPASAARCSPVRTRSAG